MKMIINILINKMKKKVDQFINAKRRYEFLNLENLKGLKN
jgi:hypothetical protein